MSSTDEFLNNEKEARASASELDFGGEANLRTERIDFKNAECMLWPRTSALAGERDPRPACKPAFSWRCLTSVFLAPAAIWLESHIEGSDAIAAS